MVLFGINNFAMVKNPIPKFPKLTSPIYFFISDLSKEIIKI